MNTEGDVSRVLREAGECAAALGLAAFPLRDWERWKASPGETSGLSAVLWAECAECEKGR